MFYKWVWSTYDLQTLVGVSVAMVAAGWVGPIVEGVGQWLLGNDM